MLTPQEIIEHTREDLRRWLMAPGNDVPAHEVEDEVDRMLAGELARKLASAMMCARFTEEDYLRGNERAQKQLWNW